MSVNNNNQPWGSPPFGNAAMASANMLQNFNVSSQSQSQPHIGAGFPGHFNMAQVHAQAIAQVQLKAHAHTAQAAQAQLQAQGMTFNQAQGIANLGTSSPTMLGSGNLSSKRIPHKPPVRPPGPSGVSMMSPMRNSMELTPAARRKKQKLPEKQMHDKVAAILPESALYTQLLEFEARVDSALMRKKIDTQEALKNPPCVQKTLRIYVFNTSANQTQTIPKKPNTEPPTWTLKIIGRILEDEVDLEQAANMGANTMYPKFSSFLKRATILLDQRLYPDNHLIIWDSSRASAHQEGFEIKRKGDQEFTATIRLDMNYVPEKFKLSAPLMEIVGLEVDTRPRVVGAIWHYVKARKLQDPNDPSFFNCDQPLQKVFGEEKMKFAMVSQKISQHLSPPQAIHLEHKIRLFGSSQAGNACYDVLVDIPLPIQRELNMLLSNTEKTKEIEACDEAICAAIKKIHEHRRRRAFFLGFSQSPVEFINALIDSQRRDLKIASGEASCSAEKEHRSDFFVQPWVEDAVLRYLTRKPLSGADAP